MLNVRIKYFGGVAVYYNGFLVARFNLGADFTAEILGDTMHDASSFSKSHVLLPMVGQFIGKNEVAYEIHRSQYESASDFVVFDATGVFGVNECSILTDSYSIVDENGDVERINNRILNRCSTWFLLPFWTIHTLHVLLLRGKLITWRIASSIVLVFKHQSHS